MCNIPLLPLGTNVLFTDGIMAPNSRDPSLERGGPFVSRAWHTKIFTGLFVIYGSREIGTLFGFWNPLEIMDVS